MPISSSPTVTVAICTWNRCESLRRTLEAFLALRVPPEVTWELLVINNNSTDATDAVAAEFTDRLPLRLLQEPRPGQSYARNLAIEEARGRYLLWTDDDVLVDPQWMSALLSALITFGADWAFGRSEPQWPHGKPAWYAERFRNYFGILDYGPKPFVVQDFDQHFYGLNFGGTVEAHRTLGGFCVEFGLRGDGGGVGEDTDIFERAFGAHMKIVYTPDALVRHVIAEIRTHKAYHRRRQWVAHEVYFRYLSQSFPNAPVLLGLPRFFFSRALEDAAAYAASIVRRDRGEAFHRELQLVRFARLSLEAARHGFRAATPPARRAMANDGSR
jgi:glycosyltransferase involved in cell wall biosynthesis